jgi:hypothetical protein
MEQLLHVLGLCPDSNIHLNILRILMGGVNDIYYAIVYLKHFQDSHLPRHHFVQFFLVLFVVS